jgi:hypothetical protein
MKYPVHIDNREIEFASSGGGISSASRAVSRGGRISLSQQKANRRFAGDERASVGFCPATYGSFRIPSFEGVIALDPWVPLRNFSPGCFGILSAIPN